MSKKRKSYSAFFKSLVVLSAMREEGSLSELSSLYGVNANMIRHWKQQALSGFSSYFNSLLKIVEYYYIINYD